MQALILAAGRGSRLGDLTQNQPKGLTRVLDKPLVDWQLQAIIAANINNTAIATGYLAQAFSSYSSTKIHNPNWASSNMVRTLLCCDNYLAQDTTIISYSDIIYTQDTVLQLAKKSGDIALCYDPHWLKQWLLRFDDPLDDAETFKLSGDQLLHIGKKARDLSEIQGQYMGLLKLTPTGWHTVKTYLTSLSDAAVNQLDMTSLLEQLLQQNKSITLSENKGFWFEVDSPKDLDICQRLLQQNAYST